MKKRIMALILGITLLASTAIAGCGNKQETTESGAEEKITIRWVSLSPGKDGEEGKTKPILEAFEEETGIRVEAEFYAITDLAEVIETKAAAGNTGYDVMSVDVTYIAKYGSSGYLEALDQYFTDEEKAEWSDASLESGIWEDKLYAAPRNTSAQLLIYNKTLLEEAGITVPENSPENRLTYEQVAQLAKEGLEKLDPDGSRGLTGFDFQQVSRVYQMNMLPNSLGGKNIGDDGYEADGIINSKEWEEAMSWYQQLVQDGIASRGYNAEQVAENFYSGKTLFMVGGTWTPTRMIAEDELGYAYAPCFEGYEDTTATGTGSWYMGMDAQSKEKEAAAEFIKFFTLGKGNDMWLEIDGAMPSRLAKVTEIENDPDASEALKIGAYESAHTAFPRAVTPAFGEYSTILDQTWEDVRNGADVKEALDSAVEQLETAMSTYR